MSAITKCNHSSDNAASFVNHPAIKNIYKGTVKIVSVVAAGYFLNGVANYLLFPLAAPTMHSTISLLVFVAPVFEEIIFRQVIQGTIHSFQKLYNRIVVKKVLSQNDLKAQEIFRVRCSAICFGACRLFKIKDDAMSIILRIVYRTTLGLGLGYMVEKYKSLTLPILAHGVNNSIAALAYIYSGNRRELPEVASLIVGLFALNLLWYKLGIRKGE
ncbi:MAG: CPBP family intramembrane metalloprotease [Parachlamydiaceae bacterium]|nr:CPBP family intramembrane metalloprotease [Parachlamydiaceae bacterium]